MRCSAIKRAAALRELADLGCHKARAAKLLGITRTAVARLCRANGIEMGNKTCIKDITLKRVAAMREMASLGRTADQVAILLALDISRVSQLRIKYSIPLAKSKNTKLAWLQTRILRDYGKAGITPSIMAMRYGTSANSVNVRINQMRKEGKLPPVQSWRIR